MDGPEHRRHLYDLADEYGILIWNNFWLSTQDWNLEPDDVTLVLDNAKEVISRYRNHPSVPVWCGRNEGVPPPTINKGLAKLITDLDGTRYYSADSNKINLHDSGPKKSGASRLLHYFVVWVRGRGRPSVAANARSHYPTRHS